MIPCETFQDRPGNSDLREGHQPEKNETHVAHA